MMGRSWDWPLMCLVLVVALLAQRLFGSNFWTVLVVPVSVGLSLGWLSGYLERREGGGG